MTDDSPVQSNSVKTLNFDTADVQPFALQKEKKKKNRQENLTVKSAC